MPRYVAFLRAINVGGHVVRMERLREIFEWVGVKNVETFIASGNVIFESAKDAAKLEKKIEHALMKELGYAVPTFLRTDAEVAEIAKYQPFSPTEELPQPTLFVGFLSEAPRAESAARLVTASTEIDQFHINRRELYWRCRGKLNESPFSGAKLEKMLGLATTLRNVNTVRRLAAKYPPR